MSNPSPSVLHLFKVCTKCGVEKPLKTFKLDSKGKGGIGSICKPCNSQYGYKLESFVYNILNKRGKLETLSVKDVLELFEKQCGLCALTGVPMTHIVGEGNVPTNLSLDRIESGGTYTKNNVRLVCRVVNHMRWTSTDETLFWWCEQILKKRGK